MFKIEVDDSVIRARLDSMPARVHDALLKKVSELAEKLRTHVVSDKLSGQVLNRRTGALARSIAENVEDAGTSITGKVFSSGDVKYAAIHEYGGVTAAHVIEAKNASVLAFMANGKQVFAKRVNHPGSRIPERSYMRSSLGDMTQEIIDGMTQAVKEGAAGQ